MKLLLLLALLFAAPAGAVDYFVRNGGSDAAAGTSDATAWATPGRIVSGAETYGPGDTISFACGSTWYTAQDVVWPSGKFTGTQGNPVVIKAYGGVGSTPACTNPDSQGKFENAPIISGAKRTGGSNWGNGSQSVEWFRSNETENVYYLRVTGGGDPNVIDPQIRNESCCRGYHNNALWTLTGTEPGQVWVWDLEKCDDQYGSGGPPENTGTQNNICDADGSTPYNTHGFPMRKDNTWLWGRAASDSLSFDTIYVRPASGAPPEILIPQNSNNIMWLANGIDNVTFSELRLYGARGQALSNNSTNTVDVVFDKMELDHNGNAAFSFKSGGTGQRHPFNFQVRNSEWHNNRFGGSNVSGNFNNCSEGTGQSQRASGVIIENNIIRDNTGKLQSGGTSAADGAKFFYLNDVIARNNLVYNNASKGLNFDGTNECANNYIGQGNAQVYGNQVYDNATAGILFEFMEIGTYECEGGTNPGATCNPLTEDVDCTGGGTCSSLTDGNIRIHHNYVSRNCRGEAGNGRGPNNVEGGVCTDGLRSGLVCFQDSECDGNGLGYEPPSATYTKATARTAFGADGQCDSGDGATPFHIRLTNATGNRDCDFSTGSSEGSSTAICYCNVQDPPSDFAAVSCEGVDFPSGACTSGGQIGTHWAANGVFVYYNLVEAIGESPGTAGTMGALFCFNEPATEPGGPFHCENNHWYHNTIIRNNGTAGALFSFREIKDSSIKNNMILERGGIKRVFGCKTSSGADCLPSGSQADIDYNVTDGNGIADWVLQLGQQSGCGFGSILRLWYGPDASPGGGDDDNCGPFEIINRTINPVHIISSLPDTAFQCNPSCTLGAEANWSPVASGTADREGATTVFGNPIPSFIYEDGDYLGRAVNVSSPRIGAFEVDASSTTTTTTTTAPTTTTVPTPTTTTTTTLQPGAVGGGSIGSIREDPCQDSLVCLALSPLLDWL